MKAIRSIRRWSYNEFGYERMVKFVVMATPDDIAAAAEYIKLADAFCEVRAKPGHTSVCEDTPLCARTYLCARG